MRHIVTGPFSVQDLGNGAWQLATGVPIAAEIYLQAARSDAIDILKHACSATLDLEWHDDGVTVAGAKDAGRVEVTTAIIHEPKTSLYECLPLASFDSDAARFWNRVFRLMRLPGGRLLLNLIARRSRRHP